MLVEEKRQAKDRHVHCVRGFKNSLKEVEYRVMGVGSARVMDGGGMSQRPHPVKDNDEGCMSF